MDFRHQLRRALLLQALISLAIVLGLSLAFAHDDGRYARSPLHAWFDQLASGKGLCCSFADGERIADPDWDSKDGHYRVRLDGKWIDVPADAVVTEPNKAGEAMVWPIRVQGEVVSIRCFMPGAMI